VFRVGPFAAVPIALSTYISLISLLSAASILKKDRTMVEGEIQGIVLLTDPGRPMFAVIAGKDIEAIDERGVRLRPDSVVVHTGMPLGTTIEVFRSIKAGEVLRAVLPVAEKMDPVEWAKASGTVQVVLSGVAEGRGVGSVAIGKERAYFMKRIFDRGRKLQPVMPVSGELREERGVYTIIPRLRVQTSSGLVFVDSNSLSTLQVDSK
jgi:hypothetical protein